MCEIDKQQVHVTLRDKVRNMEKAVDDMEVSSLGCVPHTPQLTVQRVCCHSAASQTHLLTQGRW